MEKRRIKYGCLTLHANGTDIFFLRFVFGETGETHHSVHIYLCNLHFFNQVNAFLLNRNTNYMVIRNSYQKSSMFR